MRYRPGAPLGSFFNRLLRVWPAFRSGKCVTPIGNWQQNQRYKITFTRSGSAVQLYRNGVLVASRTNTPPYAPAQSSRLYIGSNTHDPATTDPTATPGGGFFTGGAFHFSR